MPIDDSDLDRLLAEVAPATLDHEASRVHVRHIFRTQAAVRPRRRVWRRPQIVLAIALLVATGTTAGAVATQMIRTGDLLVDGVAVPLDASILIAYETDSGRTISCSIGVYYYSDVADVTPLKEFMAEHDWSGIGQRIYDRAVANPFHPAPGDDFDPDTPQSVYDWFSFTNALSVMDEEIPAELMPEGTFGGTASNCTGDLR